MRANPAAGSRRRPRSRPRRRWLLVLLVLALATGGAAGIRAWRTGNGRSASSPAEQAPTPALPAVQADPVPAGFVTRVGPQLVLDGQPWRFTGVNAYQLATDWSVNVGCGAQQSDLDALFAALKPGNVVRFWAFQSLAVDKNTRTVDFGPMDRVVQAAQRHGVKLVMTLSDQRGTCEDGHYHDQAWYRGGYRGLYDDDGRRADVMSWWDWLHLVVARYKSSPAVAMWEPVNEPETSNCDPGFTGVQCQQNHDTCPGGNAELLRDFFTQVGAEVHRLDRWHPVSSGQLGMGECGSWQQFYELVGTSPGLDVLDVHDYDPAPHTSADQRIEQATDLGKPLVFEEVGTNATSDGDPNCWTLAQRDEAFLAKMDTIFASPVVSGFLVWQWVDPPSNTCSTETFPGDELMTTLRDYVPAVVPPVRPPLGRVS